MFIKWEFKKNKSYQLHKSINKFMRARKQQAYNYNKLNVISKQNHQSLFIFVVTRFLENTTAHKSFSLMGFLNLTLFIWPQFSI